MEIGINFFDCIGTDVTSNILAFLSNPADLIRVSAVSRSWRHIVIANSLFKKLWLRKFPQLSNIACAFYGSDEIIKLSDITTSNPLDWETLEIEHETYSCLLYPLAKPIISPRDCVFIPIGASSTDQPLAEHIINTLVPIDRFAEGASYWSSKGVSDPDIPESIVYRLPTNVMIVTEIDIRPFEAFWKNGKPVYSAKWVRFRMGHPRSQEDLVLVPIPLQQPCLDKYIWTYTSPQFPMTQESRLQQFKLPEPIVCVGGILQIELLGRAQREEKDGLFYICLGYVRVLGRSLEPAFNLEISPGGELLLKYHPDVLDGVLRSLSREFSSSAKKPVNDLPLQMQDLWPVPVVEKVLKMVEAMSKINQALRP